MSSQFVNLKKACDDLQDSRRQLEVQHSNLQVRSPHKDFLDLGSWIFFGSKM
jgi:hypothetical protein